jgi:hypothetical protein
VGTRNWLLVGARIGEIIARKLTLNHRIERLVWSRQIASGYFQLVPVAGIEVRQIYAHGKIKLTAPKLSLASAGSGPSSVIDRRKICDCKRGLACSADFMAHKALLQSGCRLMNPIRTQMQHAVRTRSGCR